MSSLPIDKAEDKIDAEVTSRERTDFELIDALSRTVQNYAAALYKKGEVIFSDVKFDIAWEDRSIAWADLEARFDTLRQAAENAEAECSHFKSHFTKLAKVNPAASAALDTARREWAKKGEGT